MPRAVGLTAEILEGWAPVIRDLRLIPGSKGAFEVIVDGELLYSKHATGRHAQPGEVVGLLREKIGEEVLGEG